MYLPQSACLSFFFIGYPLLLFLLFFVLLFLKLIFYVTMQGCASVVTLTTVYFPIALDLE